MTNAWWNLYNTIRSMFVASPNQEREIARFQNEADNTANVIVWDPLTVQLNKMYSPPFNQWENQMFGENIPQLQRETAWSMMEPPALANVGPMMMESLYNRSYKNLGYDVSGGKYGGNSGGGPSQFSFTQRLSNLLEAALGWNGVGLFWIETSQLSQEAGSANTTAIINSETAPTPTGNATQTEAAPITGGQT